MKKSTQGEATPSSLRFKALEALTREQIQHRLQRILEGELPAFLGRPKSERRTEVDAKPGYRNGHGRERRLATSMGTVRVSRPQVRGSEEPFDSKVLLLLVRRTKQVGALLPTRYLHGLAMGDFELTLRGLLGEGAPLSKASLERLKAGWQQEHAEWSRRSLVGKEVAYVWADGVYVKAGLKKEKAAVLVLMGALRNGRKKCWRSSAATGSPRNRGPRRGET
ncbi:transposase [Corallococcus sp. NCSPR001]|nr:transposase [Corallococcus sp. NCRR]MBN9686130.1 transposase [Corallococcus sp. NCSPR001]WAS82435.1 transposase [Corallococcus sp. NCRR]